MTILFSALATVDFDGKGYYCNEINASLNRYKSCGEKIICLAHLRNVQSSKHDPINMDGIEFVFIHKINTPRSLLMEKQLNGEMIENAVKRSDLCITHVYSTHAGMVLYYAKKWKKPSVNVVVGDPWDSFWNYSIAGKLIAPFAYYSLKRMQQRAKYSIYVTNEYLQSRYPTTGKSIACSNVDMITGDSSALSKRQEWIDKHDHNRYKIATLAALNVRYKGQEYVINALYKLRQQGINDFEYHLAGGGDDSYLRGLIKKYHLTDCVFIHGAIPHSEITAFLDGIDIYIQPSKQEGLPRALIEAMSRGCLCLGSKVAGIPELLDSDYIFPAGNSKSIAKILSGITKVKMYEQANRNFEEAKLYDKRILDNRRKDFLMKIINKIIEEQ